MTTATTSTQTQEQIEWDMQCYGCTLQSLRKSLDNDISAKMTGNYLMVVASMMSDAQQEIEFGMDESARQTLNRAKFVLFNYVMNDNE
jgi:hypothetical protein